MSSTDFSPPFATMADLEKIWSWNTHVPVANDSVIHELFSETAHANADELAICAHDGNWTYNELNEKSTELAQYLVANGIGRGHIVPICFEKSKHTAVAVIAVMKCGAASVLLDPSQPPERLRSITSQTSTSIIICSTLQAPLAAAIVSDAANVVIISTDTLIALGTPYRATPLPIVSPSDRLYVIFTSGSTGTPKGAIITHSNYASAILHQRSAHGFTSRSRVYDFSSYAFDVSWSNLIHTLTIGACLLIPSDEERSNDLAGSIIRRGATHVDITPSIARILPDEVLEQIDVLVLGGEKLTAEHGQRWSKFVNQLKNPYGPSECTPTATIITVDPDAEYSGAIGRGLGLNTWITSAEDTNTLVPVGEVGELLLEGPLVGEGYLDATKNDNAFVIDPAFLLNGLPETGYPGRHGRLYKTGDLVRYNQETGDLVFIGRKDSQVKINGQRVELGDVEHHLREAVPVDAVQDIVAEMIEAAGSETKLLVAFFAMARKDGADGGADDLASSLTAVTGGLEDHLRATVPAYMIPAHYIPLSEFPLTATGKTDRRKLHSVFQSMSLATTKKVARLSTTKREPTSLNQAKLLKLWSLVLVIDEAEISVDDSFVRLGGDSIAAMKLVAAARQAGFHITVSDIFHHPKLEDMAGFLSAVGVSGIETTYRPASLLRSDTDLESAFVEAAALCGVSPSDVEDILPCTPLQEGLMSLSTKRDGDYVVRYILKLQPHVDLPRLCRAWDVVLSSTPILRTRIVNLRSEGLVQIVLRHQDEYAGISREKLPSLDSLGQRSRQFGLGTSLGWFELARTESDKAEVCFVWKMHHAIYDGWSVNLMIERLQKAYLSQNGDGIQASGFHMFIDYVNHGKEQGATDFWRQQSAGIEAQTFPPLPAPGYDPKSDSFYEFTIDNVLWPAAGGTAPSTLRAALSILLNLYTASPDIVFGTVTSGRQAPVPHIDVLVAPTIATVPVRVSLDMGQDIQSLLSTVQKQLLQTIAFEQSGLHNIRRISSDAEQLCSFQTLLVVQPAEDINGSGNAIFADAAASLHEGDITGAAELGTYALTIECLLQENGVSVRVLFDSKVIGRREVQQFASQYEHIVHQLCMEKNASCTLENLKLISHNDMAKIWSWNQTVPETAHVCVHELIETTARRQPLAPAICAWDGDFSYAELDDLATKLALHLNTLPIAGTIVPLIFEKSKWTSVAMLAVMKAGAAFVALDPSQPEERLRTIVDQVNAVAIVSSRQNSALAQELTMAENVVLESQSPSLLHHNREQLPTVSSSSPLYLIFTSGSTGTPKGVVISHSNFSSAILHQQSAHGFEPTSRVYDFASYAFDVSMSNIFHTLTIGACLCVPSEEERRDDLTGSLARFGVTHADLTPSTAAVLPEESLKKLTTLVLGGEKLSADNARYWSSLTALKNPYGPSECTPTATIQHITPNDTFTASIGKGLGLNTWVADPASGRTLVPIGAVGELLLEGPLVGLGYLGDEAKTKAAFVDDAAFLQDGAPGYPGRAGRLYKTGDLVRYNEDGSLTFIGRKDAQVKINGQRVELSDIESHIARHAMTYQASCAYPKTGLCANKVVGFFSLSGLTDLVKGGAIELISAAHQQAVTSHIAELEMGLRESLPAYMVPSVWVPLKELPLSTSGKLDSKRLRQWIETADEKIVSSLAKLSGSATARREPATELEQLLSSACCAILNIPEDAVNLDKSFISNGGDSISAMRLSAHCRAANVTFSVAQLLKSKSLAIFAATGMRAASVSPTSFTEEVNKPFSLSPIQQWYFDQTPYKQSSANNAWCNQGFYVQLNKEISGKAIFRALDSLVKHHSMLRSRFQYAEDKWTQLVLPHSGKADFLFSEFHASALSNIESLAVRRHKEIDPIYGPVFSADFCTLGDNTTNTYLILIAHHLVVDLVSWRIILEDLETLLSHGSPLSSLPFQTWNNLQSSHATTLNPESVLSTTNVQNNIDFWQLPPEKLNTVEEHSVRTAVVDKDITTYILSAANDALNTEPVEILMAGVWHAFFATFPERSDLTMFSEGHGREPWSAELDISRTVGWFTSISPINIAQTAASTHLNLLKYIKDARRRLPANGMAYFASRYLSEQGRRAFESHDSIMEMTFNYHGQFQQLEKDDTLFSNVILRGIEEQGPLLPASSLFGIEVSLEDGKAVFSVSANRHIAHQDMINTWISEIPVSLRSICNELLAYTGPRETLCDYPFLAISHQSLEVLQQTIIPVVELANGSKVQTILPCTPTVDGILISQIKDAESYKTVQRFHITSETDISLNDLSDSWQRVVDRQPGLRTTFIPALDSDSAYYQVVLEQHVANVMLVEDSAYDAASASSWLDRLDPFTYPTNCPPHRLVLCRISSSDVICQMEMSHAITDGASTSILQKDWAEAYANKLRTTNLDTTTEAFAQYLFSTPKSTKNLYWREKLSGTEPCHFPRIAHSVEGSHALASAGKINGALLASVEAHCGAIGITVASFLQTAWALSLAAYTSTDSVVFGYLASGRDVPIPGIEEATGAFTNMLVCRVVIDRQSSGDSLLRAVHDQIMEDLSYQHSSLANVQHDLMSKSEEPLFNNIVSYQRQDDKPSTNEGNTINITVLDGEDPTEYDLVVNISHGEESVEILLDHKSDHLTSDQARRLLSLFHDTCVALSTDINLADAISCSVEDATEIGQWNGNVPATINDCVHDLIAGMALSQPKATAIDAWDGIFTYEEVDTLTTQLGQYLVRQGVANGHVIPLCVEKSCWTPILMLGVMKAGAASVVLDSSQPEDRLQTIINQTESTVILSSTKSYDLASRLGHGRLATSVDKAFFTSMDELVEPLPTVSPADSIYVVFTSGSTGVPKGVVVTHANIASAIHHQRSALQFNKESRIFDFSSYMFDVAWCNLLHGLAAGGCVCIPAEEDRKSNIMSAIRRFKANSVILTPSALRGYDLDALNGLRSLHFIGEALRTETFASVHPSVNVTNLYGPTECTTFSTMTPVIGRDTKHISIGFGSGLTPWVVDPTTGSSLVPIGVTGELLLEGPLVSNGYLGDSEKTKLVFVESPKFLRDIGRSSRLYKTGDLVRYDASGALTFVGRKDAQVKINGMRVELGEIEFGVKSCLSEDLDKVDVVAEVITPQGSSHAILIAFICFGSEVTERMDLDKLTHFTYETTKGLRDVLATRVAAHMIPFAYVPLQIVPTTASGKTDRRRLREMAAALSWEQLLSRRSKSRRMPGTPAERRMQALWSEVLDVDPSLIGVDDSFLRIGGDSVGAMRLVGVAREAGFALSVADILRNPKLSDMALLMDHKTPEVISTVTPFSLVQPSEIPLDAMIDQAAMACNLLPSDIEDMYPCTPLQEGLLALTVQRSGDYIIRCALQLKSDCDVPRFKKAWDSVTSSVPILRTRIVDITGKGLTQISTKHSPSWNDSLTAASLREYTEIESREEFALGSPLVKYGVLTSGGDTYFMLTLHHAIYDGWSLNLIFNQLEKVYAGENLENPYQFQSFVKFIQSVDQTESAAYWNTQLHDSEAQAFPVLPSSSHQVKTDQRILHQIEALNWEGSDSTPSAIIRAALAILTATYSSSADVIYGATTTGRQAAVPGVESIVGPTIATVPIHVSVPADAPVSQFLATVQEQSIEMTSYEQMGLQNIRRISATADRLCNFQTLLIVQPADESAEWKSQVIARDVYETSNADAPQESENYALTLECHLQKNALKIKMNFDSSVMHELQAQRFLRQLEHTIRQLSNPAPGQLVCEVSCLSDEDSREIWNWNASVPETVNTCVHELIMATCRKQPESQAVCAWDGNWTYSELDHLSTQVAWQLLEQGIGPGQIIPLVFEKSKWTPIAMLGVMKAGAASVAVDTSQPADRLRSIISQVQAPIVLCSDSKEELASTLSAKPTFVIGASTVQTSVRDTKQPQLPTVSPDSLLYLVFTSGSTGTPKGVMITHRNFSSAIKHQKDVQGILPTSRVFDFASYAFDVAWANFMLTFEVGATLCIPSDSDRKDDLNGVISRLKPTHADLTPSAALVLSDESFCLLQSLTLGGERLAAAYAQHWATFPNLTVRNSYGPSECTPTSTFTEPITVQNATRNSIGHAYGLNTWVADVATGQSLVPVGAIGELLLEGPLLGNGYLGDPAKTNSAFISNPKFLLCGPDGQSRHGRVYRTGDIVKYNSDGTIAFVGRKDAQVKINGQRVELSEIENHVGRFEGTQQNVIVLPTKGPCAKRLVCVLQLKAIPSLNDKSTMRLQLVAAKYHDTVSSHLKALQEQLQSYLPPYMVPSIWAVMEELPMTASGKQDRLSINNWVAEMSPELFAHIDSSGQELVAREPSTEMERIIQEACSAVLNLPPEQLNFARSFIANGGDSISAMRLASQLRLAQVVFSVAELLQSKSLEEFALTAKRATLDPVTYIEQHNTLLPLSPIQQWYFDQDPPRCSEVAESFYNQGFYVRLTKNVPTDEIMASFAKLVESHSMLRARFEQQNGVWKQRILPIAHGAYNANVMACESLEEIKILTQERHCMIDIERGPVFSADICELNDEQYLILVAHHLVIDLVSWRVILDDLKMILNGVELPKAMPFQLWNELQTQKAASLTPDLTLAGSGATNNIEFWTHESPGLIPNKLSDHDIIHLNISEETTSLILGAANSALNTEPVEILLASVWHSFLAAFPEREALTIFNEGHGRESWSAEIDLSRTIGWFTTLSPLHVAKPASILDLVRTIKDARRQLPYNGWAYFASLYLNSQVKEDFMSHNTDMEVVFNYHGLFQQFEDESALFQDVHLEGVSEQGHNIPASSLFNIEVSIEKGQTCFDFSFNRHIAHQERINKWIVGIEHSLESISRELVEAKPSRTLSDFEHLKLNYRTLDNLSNDILAGIESLNQSSVQDVFPCSTTVDGMLLSQMRDSSAYKTKQLYEISSVDGQAPDAQNALFAWQSVIEHQPALRTVFINGQDDASAFDQVVLAHHQGNSILLSANTDSEALQKIQDVQSVEYQLPVPPHRAVFCQTPEKLFWQLEMSHTITDGASTGILEQNFIDAFSGQPLTNNMLATMQGYAKVLSASDKTAKTAFWRKKLSNMEPCQFPKLSPATGYADRQSGELTASLADSQISRLMTFCAAHMITPASLFQSAWALTLSAYTGRHSVCFGYLASGRDVDVPYINESVGAYTNMMICRAEIGEDFSGSSFAQQIHQQLMEDLNHQHISLATIQHDHGISADQQFFNSIVSYQRIAEGLNDKSDNSIMMKSIDGDDPTEYAIGLGINHGRDLVELDLSYSSTHLTEKQAARVLSHIQSAINVIIEGTQPRSLSDEDLHDIWSWNAAVPEASEICVHELIAETAKSQPESPAICAWDGDFTYRELDSFANRLAHYLRHLGVTTKAIVPHCIEKSKWAPIATLAVMKAGGASVTLDVNQPFDRLESIVAQITSPVILASPGQEALAKKLLGETVVVVDEMLLHSIPLDQDMPLPKVNPSSWLYVNFTSGSTGVPKGVAISHSNYSSAIKHQQAAHYFKPTSRVFDFAYQSFDVSWSNFCHTFTIGACLCVPSDDERRNDAAGAIHRMRVTHADMTPSAISTLPLETLSQLDTIVLGGEKLSAENARAWSSVTKVLNPYGPCECTPTSTITEVDAIQAATGIIPIGKGIGLNTWIVDASKGESLVPIGAVGELVLEGPLVGEYLGENSNATSFITSAPYLSRGAPGHSGRTGRMYKTGDLVRYNTDGTLLFVGRKDGQVKINGQRVELGDIESHIEACITKSTSLQVVAEVVTPAVLNKPMLVAFIIATGEDLRDMDEAGFRDFVKQNTRSLQERLALQLPAYMIPVAYIPVLHSPLTATGKTDRRQLRNIATGLTREDLLATEGSGREYRKPSGTLETELQRLWSTVLDVEPGSISANDDFLKLGGDSISAMRLVSVARASGYLLTVGNILSSKIFCDQALLLKKIGQEGLVETTRYEPFSLLPRATLDDKEALYSQLYELGIISNMIEDIMPVTDHQARCIALTHSANRNLLLYQTMDGSGEVNIGKLRATCASLVRRFDLLRTVFVAHKDAFLQVVLKEIDVYVPVFTTHSGCDFDAQTEQIRQHDLTARIPFGRPLTRISIIHNVAQQTYRIIVRMSHAQHDGMSLVKMWDAFEEMYRESLVSANPINPRPEDIQKASFSNYMFALSRMNKESAIRYWRQLLDGSTMTTLTSTATYKLAYGEGPSTAIEIPRNSVDGGEFTFSTVLKSAWAYTLAQATAEDDIVFGTLTHGRGLPGVEDVFGACVNIIPTRVKLGQNWTARDLVSYVNSQQIASMDHETLGTREIIRACTGWSSWAFAGTVVYHHNFEDTAAAETDRGMHSEDEVDLGAGDLDMVDIHVTSKAHKESYRIDLSFGPGLYSDTEAQKLSNHLRSTIMLFCRAMDTTLQVPSSIKYTKTPQEEERAVPISVSKSGLTASQINPSTQTALLQAWSETLNRSVEECSTPPRSLFESGGDLVSASLLAAHMELKGYSLSVEDIVRNPDWESQLSIIEHV
ncbi:hypothetical protein NLG97_g303 [Lecanicillium saksenae]|uniref:Uncharacterized protein n=1 Tax=Lecanicillium saksenae TaxID=468837 RepID=A0ACC1R8T8_9HYPO|nr:hypothetical protein NLG97_g303 [Lecanicillium saksenae]